MGLPSNSTITSPPRKPALAAGDPADTSANFTPLIPSAKSGTDPNHGPYPEPDDEVTGPASPPPWPPAATRTNSGRPASPRRLSTIAATMLKSFEAAAASILSHVSLGLW